jgi:uncharacterized membrane protein
VQSSTLAARILVIALGAVWLYLAWGVWNYLQVGYSLRIGFEGASSTVSKIEFPPERRIVAIALAVAVAAGSVAAALGHRRTPQLFLLIFVFATAVGLWDADQYGTIKTPTKLISLAVLAGAYIASRYALSRERHDKR